MYTSAWWTCSRIANRNRRRLLGPSVAFASENVNKSEWVWRPAGRAPARPHRVIRVAELKEVNRAGDVSPGQLLDEFARLRSENLRDLRALNLRPEDLARRGRHPALGAVTLSELLATWAAHDLTHLHQISRVMAHQYRDAVGPWSAFLGVLHCAGHSSP